jgi:hypothetical protein
MMVNTRPYCDTVNWPVNWPSTIGPDRVRIESKRRVNMPCHTPSCGRSNAGRHASVAYAMNACAGDPSLVALHVNVGGHPYRSLHGRATAVDEHRDLLEQPEPAERTAIPVRGPRLREVDDVHRQSG